MHIEIRLAFADGQIWHRHRCIVDEEDDLGFEIIKTIAEARVGRRGSFFDVTISSVRIPDP